MTARPDGRGMSESVQLSVLIPLILLIIFGVIQAGVTLGARSAVRDAAMAAAEAASLATAGRQAVAHRVASDVAARAGITRLAVAVRQGRDTVTVDVTGRVGLALGIVSPNLSASATLPVHH